MEAQGTNQLMPDMLAKVFSRRLCHTPYSPLRMFPKLSIPSLELEGKPGPYSSFRTIPETFFTSTLAQGANTALSFVNSRQLNSNESFTMLRIANVIEDKMDGTSEPIFSTNIAA